MIAMRIIRKWDRLTHRGRVTYICASQLTIIGSDNGLSPGRRQAIIWTNAGLLLIWHLETNFSEILIKIHTFSFKKIHLKMSSGKWRPFCLGLNELKELYFVLHVKPLDYIPFLSSRHYLGLLNGGERGVYRGQHTRPERRRSAGQETWSDASEHHFWVSIRSILCHVHHCCQGWDRQGGTHGGRQETSHRLRWRTG